MTPLLGAPLNFLDATGVGVADLRFLQDALIRSLSALLVPGTMSDLSPLRDKPLRFLLIWSDRLTDLSPLRGAPLEQLQIERCPRVTDLTPLADLPNLQKLRVAKLGKSMEPLRTHQALKLVSQDREGSYRPVAEFWAEYDAKQAAGKK